MNETSPVFSPSSQNEQQKEELDALNLKFNQATKKCAQQDDIIRELQDQARSKARADALGEELSAYRQRLAEAEVCGGCVVRDEVK